MADHLKDHRKRVDEKRLVLVYACEQFQRAASRRPFPYSAALTHEERPALEYLEEAIAEFRQAWVGQESARV
jgi:hypothetical protein